MSNKHIFIDVSLWNEQAYECNEQDEQHVFFSSQVQPQNKATDKLKNANKHHVNNDQDVTLEMLHFVTQHWAEEYVFLVNAKFKHLFQIVCKAQFSTCTFVNDKKSDCTTSSAPPKISPLVQVLCSEIRNPLNGILGCLHMLTEPVKELECLAYGDKAISKQDVEPIVSLLTDIHDCAEYQNEITTRVMDMAAEADGNVKEGVIVPNQLVRAVHTMHASKLKEKQLHVQLHLLEDDKMRVLGDGMRIKQVLCNLLSNAVQSSMPKELITVKVDIKPASDKNHVLELIVTDTRRHECCQSRLLDCLSWSPLKSHKHENCIGLCIAKSLLKLMGGSLHVEQACDTGNIIVVSIPIKLASAIEEVGNSTCKASAANASSFSNKRVLVVDDNDINRKVLSHIVQKCGCECHVACNGQQAVEMASQLHYDIIFLDVEMPIMNGICAAKAMRSNGITVPIICVTGSNEYASQVADSGMNLTIAKPYLPEQIVHTLKTYL